MGSARGAHKASSRWPAGWLASRRKVGAGERRASRVARKSCQVKYGLVARVSLRAASEKLASCVSFGFSWKRQRENLIFPDSGRLLFSLSLFGFFPFGEPTDGSPFVAASRTNIHTASQRLPTCSRFVGPKFAQQAASCCACDSGDDDWRDERPLCDRSARS